MCVCANGMEQEECGGRHVGTGKMALGTKVYQAPRATLALISPTPTSPLADLYSEEPGEEEPAWVQTERQQFREFRDLNKDGRLDGSEVGYWVLPPSQDQPLVEANHLLHESDKDKVSLGYYCLHSRGSRNRERNRKRPRDRWGPRPRGEQPSRGGALRTAWWGCPLWALPPADPSAHRMAG